MTPWDPERGLHPERARERRQGFLEARLASSAGTWLRDARRTAQARGMRATGLSLTSAAFAILAMLSWVLAGPWHLPLAQSGSLALLCGIYGACAIIAWCLHLHFNMPRQRRRRRGR